MHHKSIIYNKPTRCNSGSIVFIKNYKYAVHVSDALLLPSSGALWTVTAATCACHELGWNKSCIDVKVGKHCTIPWPKCGLVQCSLTLTSIPDLFQPSSWQTPVVAVTVYSALEDGRKGRPKHVEHTCSFNKHNTARVASCWFMIYCRLVMYGNSNIKLIFFTLSPI